jgi:zinc protease
MQLLRSAVLVALLASACATVPPPSAAAPAPPAAAEKITTVEGITEYRLQNGLRVLLFPDATKETITVNVTYLVGSRHEGYGETGMAHLLEHLVFKGTDRHPNITQELTAHGARPNGTTSYDRTNYFETFKATDENLRWALDLEADRMVNSHIAKKDLDSEMTVVRNEYERGENSPFGVLYKRMLATMFDWHGYGRSTIGARSDIERVPIERLQEFYRRFYQPDNAVLTIAGRFDEAEALAQIGRTFGPLPRPPRKLIPTYTEEPTQDGERMVTLRRVGDVQIVAAGYHVPSGVHPDSAALEVLAYVLGDTPAGRLHKALVETGKASRASGSYSSLAEPGVLTLLAEVRQEQSLAQAREVALATLDTLSQHPVTDEEVERARNALLKQIVLTLNHAEVVGLRLSEFIAKGDWRLFFLRRDRLRKVTAADVNRVIAAYLKPTNRTVALFIPDSAPDRAEIPAAPEASALLQGYTGDTAVAQGEAFDPSPANIEARTRRGEAGPLKTALLPKKTRGGVVHASLALHYGDVESLHDKSAVGDMAIDLLVRGSRQHTRQQIADAFDQLKARVHIGGGGGTLHASVETVRENLPAVLRLLAEVLREPAFPQDQFAQLMQQDLAGIESQRSEPQSMAGIAYERHQRPYPKGDPRYTGTPDEELAEYKAVTLEQVKAFYEEFLGASHGELAVVGDFDPDQVQKLATELFADWKTRRPYARVPSLFHDVRPETRSLEAPDKANAVLLAGQNLKLRDDDPDWPALVLGNYMIGGGFLNSRLAVRIRQKEGLSYGVSSSISAGALDQTGSFSLWAIHAPQNTARLEQAMREEVARALADGFAPDELREARAGYLQTRQVGRAQDSALAGKLSGYLFLGRTLAWDADFDKRIAELTNEQIVAALRRHLDLAKLTVVRAGDFAKAKQGAATGAR